MVSVEDQIMNVPPAAQPLLRFLPYLYIAALVAAGWYIWDRFTPAPAPVNQYQPAPEAKPVIAIPKVNIHPKDVKVYAQPAKAALKLPPNLQADPNTYALSAVKIKPDLHPQTIVTTLNAETGETETLVRRDPLSWFAPEQTGEIRLGYGYKYSSLDKGRLGGVTRLSLREDLLQVKALHAGINASLDSDGQLFAGAGVGWKW